MTQSISSDIKQKIIKEVRDDGKKVIDIASKYNVSTKAIYNWLRDGIGTNSSTLEIAKLKRENEQLYAILGKVTAELKRPKK